MTHGTDHKSNEWSLQKKAGPIGTGKMDHRHCEIFAVCDRELVLKAEYQHGELNVTKFRKTKERSTLI